MMGATARGTAFAAGQVVLLAAALALPGCLLPPANVREQVRPARPPAPNHYAGRSDAVEAAPGKPVAVAAFLVPPAAPLRTAPPPALLRTGMVVATEEGSAQGMFLSLFAAEPHAFVHTGLIAVEDGQPVVYEAVGQLQASIGSAPTDRLTGNLRRTPWPAFERRHRYIALFEPPPGTDTAAMAAFARYSHASGLPFDPRFDLADPSRMYCSEFTAAGLSAGGLPVPRAVPLNPNPSLAIVLGWLGIEPTELQTAGSVTGGLTLVALWSPEHSPAQVDAWFAAKAELHRRFTDDQRLGNLISYSPLRGLRFQPRVQDFIAAVGAAATGWPDPMGRDDPAIRSRVRALAATYLGPYPGD